MNEQADPSKPISQSLSSPATADAPPADRQPSGEGAGSSPAASATTGSAKTDPVGELERAVRGLSERFDKHIAGSDRQRKAFDTLYAELQGYKDSFLLNKLHKPVIRNLVRLYDSFENLEDALPRVGAREDGPSVEAFVAGLGHFVRNMENFGVELTEVLARLDVETYDDRHDALGAERMAVLDRKLHRTVSVESTADPARHNEVVRVHKQGFYWQDRVFRPAEVTVLRHDSGAASDGGDDG